MVKVDWGGSVSGGYAGPDRHFVTTSFPPRAKKPRNEYTKLSVKGQVAAAPRPFPDLAFSIPK